MKARKALPLAYPKEIKTLGDHIRKKRLDLGLLQREVAKQIGVSKNTICNWEMNRTEPGVRFIPAIINFLGYAPYDPEWTFGQRMKAIRMALGLSQEQYAVRVRLDESTIARRKRETRRPTEKKLDSLRKLLRCLI